MSEDLIAAVAALGIGMVLIAGLSAWWWIQDRNRLREQRQSMRAWRKHIQIREDADND